MKLIESIKSVMKKKSTLTNVTVIDKETEITAKSIKVPGTLIISGKVECTSITADTLIISNTAVVVADIISSGLVKISGNIKFSHLKASNVIIKDGTEIMGTIESELISMDDVHSKNINIKFN